MRIGVLSDTHGFLDPLLKHHFAGVELILHAGDVGSRAVLEELRLIAPVQAVQGNVDSPMLGLPLSFRASFQGIQIEVQHKLPAALADFKRWATDPKKKVAEGREKFLQNWEQVTRVVIFGHSHEPCLAAMEGRLYLNPGSAGKKRFSLPRTCGLLEVVPREIRAQILPLELTSDKCRREAALEL